MRITRKKKNKTTTTKPVSYKGMKAKKNRTVLKVKVSPSNVTNHDVVEYNGEVVISAKTGKPCIPENKSQVAETTDRYKRELMVEKLLDDSFDFWKNYLPLKVGIHDEMIDFVITKYPTIPKVTIRRVIRRHVRNEKYKANMKKGAYRWGINGKTDNVVN